MKISLKTGIALSLLPQILLVRWLATKPEWVENYYSQGIYPVTSRAFRFLFGWIPFSVGDIIYLSLTIVALAYIYRNRRSILINKISFLRDVIMVLSIAYFTFNLMWGLNYYRQPLSNTLALKESTDYEELVSFTKSLIAKTNALQNKIAGDSISPINIPYSKSKIFQKSLEGYTHLSNEYPFLEYRTPSVKKSLFNTGLSYMGYAGYLNPFTNEAQVNGLLPNFRFPVVTGHEMAHQLGYSAENETNFIGYLVTASNSDIYFQYAAYSYGLGYCLNDIRRRDIAMFDALLEDLNGGVKLNFQEMSDFWANYENPTEPVFKSIFNSFLKANNQSKGIQSYNAVVSLLVAYHKQHPL
ncbi:DUF3810 domain-containing protein [Maribacter aestuarii]|uniref:DUF3810 domain-containing protein n=1 Tax=Maribacter aestuarii TaxID=1130723 RepID=UPI00248B8D40|nr:DUF3810 domain-containing protein [Maribacter aestuarii]